MPLCRTPTAPLRPGVAADAPWALRPRLAADRRTAVTIAVGLVLAVFAVFGRAVRFGFVRFDDPMYVTQNPWVLGGLTPAGVAWAFSSDRGSVWVPLTWLSLMLDAEVYGSWAGGYHLTNVLLHAACTAGLFLVLRGATSRPWPAAIAAAVFALHPQRAEAVAWVTARKDLLSGLCLILTLWAYGWYARRPHPARYAAVATALALGLMAKSMLVTTPILLLVADFWPLGRMRGPRDAARLAVEKLPLLALSVIATVATIAVQGNTLVHEPHMTPAWRLAQATLAYVGYLGMLLWPAHLAAAYPRPGAAVPWPTVAVAGAILLDATLVAWQGRRRFPYLIAGWIWYLVAMLPVAGFFQVGVVMMADRFTYLPLVGPVVALVWLTADLADAGDRTTMVSEEAAPRACRPPAWAVFRRAAVAGVATGLVACLGTASWRQTTMWRDTETLWRRTLADTTNNWFAQASLAGELIEQRRFAEAEVHAFRALEVAPRNPFVGGQLASIKAATGRLDEALEACEALTRADPRDANAHALAGQILVRRSRHREALEHYRAALAVAPDAVVAIAGLAEARLGCGDTSEAMATLLEGRRLWPDHPLIARQLGRVLLASGRSREAAEQFRRAVDHDPDDAGAWNSLGAALGQSGRIDEAIAALRRAVEIEPNASVFHRDLGFALRANRGFAAAAASYRRAVLIDPGNTMAANDLAWLLATCPDAAVRDGAEAVILAVEASRRLDDDEPIALDTLAAAHAEAGRFAEATIVARRALELAERRGDAMLTADVRAHLARFAEGKPVRDPPGGGGE